MKVLITGIYGFVGWTLADYLTRTFPAVELFGLSRQSQSTRLASSSPMDEAKRAKPTLRQAGSLAGDTSDFDFVLKVIDEVRPDKIFHLAAHSSVTGSWQTPAETLRNNILGQCNLLEAVRTVRDGTRGYDPAVLIAGSSEEYGLVAADELLIPVQAEYYALEGLGQLLETINLIQTHIKPELKVLGAVLTMFDQRTRLSEDIMNELYKYFPDTIFRTVIPRAVRLAEAPSFGKSIAHYDPSGKGGRAYERLAREVLEKHQRVD